jgi:hypothetical protein
MKPVRDPSPLRMTLDLTPEARANILLPNEPRQLLKRVLAKRTQSADFECISAKRTQAARREVVLQNKANRFYRNVF